MEEDLVAAAAMAGVAIHHAAAVHVCCGTCQTFCGEDESAAIVVVVGA
jgi:hypothetical protein